MEQSIGRAQQSSRTECARSDEFLRERTDIENEVYVNTTINTTVLGLYIITYDVTDMAANEATQICRFVIVQDDSELYQNSIQQNHDGTPGTFTGGTLPHETGASIRVAAREVELSRNRPTKACTVWGDHTPSSAAVDGDYTNEYIMPIHTMDEYGARWQRTTSRISSCQVRRYGTT